jgi:hypothetical protein
VDIWRVKSVDIWRVKSVTICEHSKVHSRMAKLSAAGAEGDAGVVNTIGERRSQDAYGSRGRKPSTQSDKKNVTCYRCGFKGHYGRDLECPARGKTCTKCHCANHFAKMCKTKPANIKSVRDENPDWPDSHGKPDPGADYAFVVTDLKSSGMIHTWCGRGLFGNVGRLRRNQQHS